MAKMNTGYSSFSSGPEHTQAVPTLDHTPTIPTQYGIPSMSTDAFDEVPSDSDMSMAEDGPFQKLEGKLSHEKGVSDPAALAASIGRKKLGGKEYDHRISEGERHKE